MTDAAILQMHKRVRLWSIGSYWLFAFAVFAAVILLLSSMASIWIVLPIIAGIEIIFLSIGALLLRGIKYGTERFLQRFALAARLQFQWSAALSVEEDRRN